MKPSRGKPLIWYGHLTSERRLRAVGWSYVSPGLLWLALLLVLPTVALVAVSFTQRGDYGEIIWNFTFNNFRRAAGHGLFGWSADILWIFGRSVVVAAVTTIVCVLLAFPLALFVANKPARTRHLWLALVMIPFCTNLVVRTYAWMLILSKDFPPARLARHWGLIDADTALYPSQFAIYLGMISSFLPFTVLPIYACIERLDWSLVEAAGDLYASWPRVWRHAILPQAWPGLLAAVVLTFVPAMGMFVVPRLLGGSKYMLVGDLIQQQFNESRDYPFGAALSMVLVALTLAGLWLTWRRRGEANLP